VGWDERVWRAVGSRNCLPAGTDEGVEKDFPKHQHTGASCAGPRPPPVPPPSVRIQKVWPCINHPSATWKLMAERDRAMSARLAQGRQLGCGPCGINNIGAITSVLRPTVAKQ